ncbi:MAG: hypothetical protein R2784_01145 [Saprospiraceae bacterium]
MEQYLQNFPGTVIAVTHDRYFLDNVAGWILELDRGVREFLKGNYSSWLEQKASVWNKKKNLKARRKTLERELEWIKMSPKAKQSKGKARLNAYDKLASETKKLNWNCLFHPDQGLGDKVIEI